MSTMRRVPRRSLRYPSSGPRNPASARLSTKAKDSWVRLHWNWRSSATLQTPRAWNRGTLLRDMIRPVRATSHHP